MAKKKKKIQCPGCGAGMLKTDVVCMTCGFNRATGCSVTDEAGGNRQTTLVILIGVVLLLTVTALVFWSFGSNDKDTPGTVGRDGVDKGESGATPASKTGKEKPSAPTLRHAIKGKEPLPRLLDKELGGSEVWALSRVPDSATLQFTVRSKREVSKPGPNSMVVIQGNYNYGTAEVTLEILDAGKKSLWIGKETAGTPPRIIVPGGVHPQEFALQKAERIAMQRLLLKASMALRPKDAPDDAKWLSALADALKDAPPALRVQLLEKLEAAGEKSVPCADRVIPLLGAGQKDPVHVAAVRCLVAMGPSVSPELLTLLQGDTSKQMWQTVGALEVLQQLGVKSNDYREAVRKLVAESSRIEIQAQALQSFSAFPLSSEDVTLATKHLDSRFDVVQQAAAQAILGAGDKVEPALPEILAAIRNARDLREFVPLIALLTKFHAENPECISTLGYMVTAEKPRRTSVFKRREYQQAALDALKKIGPEVVPLGIEMLRNKYTVHIEAANEILLAYPDASTKAVEEALAKTDKSRDRSFHFRLTKVLEKLGAQ